MFGLLKEVDRSPTPDQCNGIPKITMIDLAHIPADGREVGRNLHTNPSASCKSHRTESITNAFHIIRDSNLFEPFSKQGPAMAIPKCCDVDGFLAAGLGLFQNADGRFVPFNSEIVVVVLVSKLALAER